MLTILEKGQQKAILDIWIKSLPNLVPNMSKVHKSILGCALHTVQSLLERRARYIGNLFNVFNFGGMSKMQPMAIQDIWMKSLPNLVPNMNKN